jgi:hypothetical protein
MGYAMVPLAFGALRRQEPDHPRPFKLPAKRKECSRCNAPGARGELSRPWLPVYISSGHPAPLYQEAGHRLGSGQ